MKLKYIRESCSTITYLPILFFKLKFISKENLPLPRPENRNRTLNGIINHPKARPLANNSTNRTILFVLNLIKLSKPTETAFTLIDPLVSILYSRTQNIQIFG